MRIETKRFFVRLEINIVPSREELVGTFFKMVHPPTHLSYVTLPYIKGITEQLTRTLRQHDITVTSKPLKTLQHLHRNIRLNSKNRRM